MAKEVAMFDPSQMPAHIAAFLDDKSNDNIEDRNSVPTLAYGGKRWVITIAGEKTPLVKKDDDGDDIPLAIMRVIILDYAKERGRAYYEGTYDPAAISAPVCWSDDGKVPHPSVISKQAPKCDGCPQSMKGSRVTDTNKQSYACTQHRMLAVVPPTKIDVIPALRLKIAITSDWDKNNNENEAKDWYAFRQYIDYLRSRGIKNTAAVITKIKFDATEYPKLLFQAGGWVSPEVLVQAVELAKAEDTQKLLGGSWTPAGADGKATNAPALPADEDDEDGPQPVPAKKAKAPVVADDDDAPAPKKTAKAAPPPVMDEDDEDEAPPAPAPKKAAKAAPAPVVDDEDDDDVIPPSKKSPAADKAKPVAAKTVVADEDDEDEAPVAKAVGTKDPKRAAKVAEAATKAKAAPVVDDDDEDAPAPAAKPKAAAKAGKAEAAPVAAKSVPKGVSDLLEDWDED